MRYRFKNHFLLLQALASQRLQPTITSTKRFAKYVSFLVSLRAIVFCYWQYLEFRLEDGCGVSRVALSQPTLEGSRGTGAASTPALLAAVFCTLLKLFRFSSVQCCFLCPKPRSGSARTSALADNGGAICMHSLFTRAFLSTFRMYAARAAPVRIASLLKNRTTCACRYFLAT